MCCMRLAENTGRKKSPFWHHHTTLSGCIFAAEAYIDNRKLGIERVQACTSMYLLTFCIHVMLPECHQWKPAVQAAAVMLRTPPIDTSQPAMSTSHIRRAILRTPPVTASHRPAARADPAQMAVRTMSSYGGMDASL